MSGSNGGVIGTVVVPTTTAASGVWRPSTIARQKQMPGWLWPALKNANFASVAAQCTFKPATNIGTLAADPTANNSGYAITGSITAGALLANGKWNNNPCFNCTSSASGAGLQALTPNASTLSMATGDFTIEVWFWVTTGGNSTNLLDFRPSDTVTPGPILFIKSTNVISLLVTGAAFNITGATTITTGAWHHAHHTRASGVSYLGMDGVQEGADFTDSTNYSNNSFVIARNAPGAALFQGLVGRVDSWRATKGTAIYSRTYTVPTAPFPDY